MIRPRRGERAQATVELALVMPLVAVLVLVALQVVVVLRDSVALTAAARAAARRAMVDPSPATVRASAVGETRLSPDRVSVAIGGDTRPGGYLTVTVRYLSPTDVPLVGAFVDDIQIQERFVVLRE